MGLNPDRRRTFSRKMRRFELVEQGKENGRIPRGVQAGFEACVDALREDTIGHSRNIISPAAAAVFPENTDFAKTERRIIYADFTATGRALSCIENFIVRDVLPDMGNTHTLTTATARQSTYFLKEARDVIATYFNCTHEDAVIFTGNGATGAIDKMVGMLIKSGGFNVEASILYDGSAGSNQQVQRFFSEDRWGSCQCTLCGVRVKSESSFRAVRTYLVLVLRCKQ